MIREYQVSTLSEFYTAIAQIKQENKGEPSDHLWFRGHSQNQYTLLPSLYRNNYYEINNNTTYSQMNLKEDYRYQHIKSRAFHSVHSSPVYESEWQEIFQHHFGRTRLMDWSESARTALSFALECFIDSRENEQLKYERQHLTPCIWILNPYKLNKLVYDYFAAPPDRVICDTFEKALEGIVSYSDIKKELANNRIYFDSECGDIDIRGILSLCVLEDYRRIIGERVAERVKSYEFNPFYYMVLRMFSDAFPFVITDSSKTPIPPLAVLHPYHSERIRAQRGAFTIFPNYVLEGRSKDMAKYRGIDIRQMERQPYIWDCLRVIYILNPNKVAEELIFTGERRSELYPDIQTYADIIETQKFYY